MSMMFMEGFDHYGGYTPNMLDGTWAQANSTGGGLGTPSYGARTGQYAFKCGPNVVGCRYVLSSAENAIFLSMGFACDSLPAANGVNQVLVFSDSGNSEICTLYLNSTGSLSLTRGSTTLGTTQGPVIVASNWHFLEMEISVSSGIFTLRVDDATATGTPVMSLTGLSIGSNDVAQIGFVNTTNPFIANCWVDDITIRNTAGSINNSWLGDRRIATLLVDADTATAGWSANRYSNIGAGILNVTSDYYENANVNAAVASPTATSLNIGNSDFTLETFVRFESLPTGSNKSVIFSRWDETNNQRSYQLFLGSQALNGGSLCWRTSTDGTVSTVSDTIVYPWTPNLDTWYNIAIVRAAGELLLFVDGQQLGLPIADTSAYFAGAAPFSLAGQVEEYNNVIVNTYLQGWFDETRFTNGVGRYTANYTPTTVEYPRSSSDPYWSDVVLLAGYDSTIQDESSYNRTMTPLLGAYQQTVADGPPPVWPVIGKAGPDDNTFIEAPFTFASSILTFANQPTAGQTVTVGTKDGSTTAVYTFETSVGTAFYVLIDTSIQQTLQNLYNAINAGPGAGTKYGTGTTSNYDVNASQLPAGQMSVSANRAGTTGNSIATSTTVTGAAWAGSTLSGGLNIPGPSNFQVQRLPADTTLISAVQVTMRSFKSDSGVGTINSAFIGPLGSVATGPTHSLTVSPIYYNDVYEVDPDTSGPISPTTVINGAIQVNRDT